MDNVLLSQIKAALWVVITFAIYVGPLIVLYITFWLMSLPLRRRERARLFLDLLEMGLADGHSPERAIIQAAESKDTSLGARFHLLLRSQSRTARASRARPADRLPEGEKTVRNPQ